LDYLKQPGAVPFDVTVFQGSLPFLKHIGTVSTQLDIATKVLGPTLGTCQHQHQQTTNMTAPTTSHPTPIPPVTIADAALRALIARYQSANEENSPLQPCSTAATKDSKQPADQPSDDASATPITAFVTMAHCPPSSALTMAVAVCACPLNASPSPLVTLPYPIFRLHIRSLGYQQLCRRCVSILTCPVQRRPVALNPNPR